MHILYMYKYISALYIYLTTVHLSLSKKFAFTQETYIPKFFFYTSFKRKGD